MTPRRSHLSAMCQPLITGEHRDVRSPAKGQVITLNLTFVLLLHASQTNEIPS